MNAPVSGGLNFLLSQEREKQIGKPGHCGESFGVVHRAPDKTRLEIRKFGGEPEDKAGFQRLEFGPANA